MGMMFWLVLAPLIAAALILVLPKMGGPFYKFIAFVGSVVPLVMSLAAWVQYSSSIGGFQFVSKLTWFTLPNLWQGKPLVIGLTFGVDGLSLPLLTLAAVVSTVAVIAGKGSIARAKEYYFWITMVSAGLFGVFAALDLFTFLAALELSLFSTFFLIYIFGEKGRQKAAFKFLIYRGFATVALLVAFIVLAYAAVGGFAPTSAIAQGSAGTGSLTLNIPALITTTGQASTAIFPSAVRHTIFIMLLLAVFIEEAFVPFHTWLPTTHEHADTSTNMLIGGILTKTGAYVLLRFGVGMLPGEVRHYGVLIAVLGVINILYGGFAAWAQKDWRRLIAFGSISHMGLVLLGIAALNTAGLQGAMFMLVSSGLLTALLFFLTGSIKDRTHTAEIGQLGGLSKRMPMLSGFLLVAALGSLGLPLTSGFISEIQAFIGGFGTYPGISFVGVVGVILSAVYLLYAMQKTTFGPTAERYAALADARPLEYVPIVILTGLVLLVGVYPDVIGHLFGLSAQALLRIGG
ncbi:NADH-quinone oxidoreductase subunit M [Alicyclobacillus cycloheptanicus]|uniref:NADH-quinone oxidoreductase subunit M n=1 Tax=Alicyclobacillus cycloheptanicus TaxID=1457 RepID=A0ABT9XI03_9BACL|nr:NADH-quinone oxidoreductase subunit M [Alicyclobacillus cycloheptanicus]MDQ0189408.1 NADH-quinone oxidoreductase subunit M [Alicyclobacillus cycloheptanicus]WDM02282.1 NADH-quinone oxidoreductase subunit M [Alicyclobacillus cycloheptanicus]